MYNNTSDNAEKRKRRYEENKEYINKRQNIYNRERIRRRKQLVNEIKVQLGCKLCGEKHISCLEFHHTDPTQKITEISSKKLMNGSEEAFHAEIAKCEVLCANCHRKLHHKIRNPSLD